MSHKALIVHYALFTVSNSFIILVTKFYQPFANLEKVERSAWSDVIKLSIVMKSS